jgi:hypothetical protein
MWKKVDMTSIKEVFQTALWLDSEPKLIPWSRVLLKKVSGSQIVERPSTFYGT